LGLGKEASLVVLWFAFAAMLGYGATKMIQKTRRAADIWGNNSRIQCRFQPVYLSFYMLIRTEHHERTTKECRFNDKRYS